MPRDGRAPADQIRRELRVALGRGLKDLSPEQRAAVDDLTSAMINKLLHVPISQLKRGFAEEDGDAALYIAALKRLFELEGK